MQCLPHPPWLRGRLADIDCLGLLGAGKGQGKGERRFLHGLAVITSDGQSVHDTDTAWSEEMQLQRQYLQRPLDCYSLGVLVGHRLLVP